MAHYPMLVTGQGNGYDEVMDKPLLSPVNDHVFKRVFGGHLNVLADFLAAVIKLPVSPQDLTVIDPHSLSSKRDDKISVLDVKVRSREYGDIDVEVQVEMHHDLWKRWQYYTAKLYTEGISAGEGYSKLKHAVSIVILDGCLIKGDAVYHHRFRLYDAENKLVYPDSMEIDLLEIPKRKDDGTTLSRWLQFFAARSEEDFMSLAQMNPAMDEAWGEIKYLSGDEQERALAESREKARRDLVAMYDTGREEGRIEGREEGRIEGRKEGRIAGREEGLQLGEANERRRMALSMRDLGIPEENILAVTGFTKEQLTKLKENDKARFV